MFHVYILFLWWIAMQLQLQLGQYTQGTGLLDAPRLLIPCSVHDLALVDNNRKASSSLTDIPADGLGELSILVGHEELVKLIL